jgi:hypothetical protein
MASGTLLRYEECIISGCRDSMGGMDNEEVHHDSPTLGLQERKP